VGVGGGVWRWSLREHYCVRGSCFASEVGELDICLRSISRAFGLGSGVECMEQGFVVIELRGVGQQD
jgi:hypothetical protein